MIVFENKPSTKTPINDLNLNANFNELKNKIINSKQSDIVTGGNPVKCGYQIDSKDVYVKRVDFGELPNNEGKLVPSGLNAKEINLIEITGACKSSSGGYQNSLNSYDIRAQLIETNLSLTTKENYTGFIGYVNIYFTYN